MPYNIISIRCLVIVILFCCEFSFGQESSPTSLDADIRAAQTAAREFVMTMQTSRDVSVLIPKDFRRDFVPHFACDIGMPVPKFYSQLLRSEKVRLFVVLANVSYLSSVEIIQERSLDSGSNNLLFARILPAKIAQNLRDLLFGPNLEDLNSKDYADFQERLSKTESLLQAAIRHLHRMKLEQSIEFQKALQDEITNKGTGYKVTKLRISDYKAECPSIAGISDDQEVYHVVTPLFLTLDLIKTDKKMKIFMVGHAVDF